MQRKRITAWNLTGNRCHRLRAREKELQMVTLWSCLFEIVVGQNAEHGVMCKRGQFANAGGTADMRIRPGM